MILCYNIALASKKIVAKKQRNDAGDPEGKSGAPEEKSGDPEREIPRRNLKDLGGFGGDPTGDTRGLVIRTTTDAGSLLGRSLFVGRIVGLSIK